MAVMLVGTPNVLSKDLHTQIEPIIWTTKFDPRSLRPVLTWTSYLAALEARRLLEMMPNMVEIDGRNVRKIFRVSES